MHFFTLEVYMISTYKITQILTRVGRLHRFKILFLGYFLSKIFFIKLKPSVVGQKTTKKFEKMRISDFYKIRLTLK